MTLRDDLLVEFMGFDPRPLLHGMAALVGAQRMPAGHEVVLRWMPATRQVALWVYGPQGREYHCSLPFEEVLGD